MVFIIDLNQIIISNIMAQIGNHTDAIEENLIRHSCLNTIRSVNMKFGAEYGEMVIATDNRRYWRKGVFSHYKQNRKKNRESSDINWDLLFGTLNKVKQELVEYFPYKVIDVEGAEADDVIGTLCKHMNSVEPILILSSDKDFIQLQKYPNVKQYSLMQKKYIKHKKPKEYIREHIIRGDKGDNIPNFLSPDNALTDGIRQKSIKKVDLVEWLDLNKSPEELFNEEQLRGYKRNEQLIDLDFIPKDIEDNILESFKEKPKGNMSKVFNYTIKFKMKLLRESIQDFRPIIKERPNTLFD